MAPVTKVSKAFRHLPHCHNAPWGGAAWHTGLVGLERSSAGDAGRRDGARRVGGWSAPQRVARLKLIVQNCRFLVLAPKGQEPNLASQALGTALRALPEHWREHFGYQPLLAESFTDPESQAGTCYKASNWQPVGFSAGYSRHRADFYVPNERPKKLWLYELAR